MSWTNGFNLEMCYSKKNKQKQKQTNKQKYRNFKVPYLKMWIFATRKPRHNSKTKSRIDLKIGTDM